ncbi:outer membrane adhesin-like protein [Haloferula helveola]|uniref:Outer membrane adhesin-like protein n=1 Tax=Haloferula helveola TaxID=490095 RepID=A0ABN6H020_9BACT|nr:outer membrane adhesin-like protein [Haloferula helveola]
MKNPQGRCARTSRPSAYLPLCFAALALAPATAFGQIVANDDGSPGSPFETTDEDTATVSGTPATSNDTGTFDVLPGIIISGDGVLVPMQDLTGTLGEFTYDPTTSGDAQALASGESLEDTFDYSIFELPATAVAPSQQFAANTGVNTLSWTALPSLDAATGTSRPLPIQKAYTFAGTNATRSSFSGVGNTADFTFEFWFKADALADQVLFETGGATIGSSILLNSDGTISYYFSVTNPESIEIRSDGLIATYVADTWHHVVVTGDLDTAGGSADRVRIYLDGVVVADDSSNTGLTNWSGGDAAGLGGGAGGDIGGDVSGTGPIETTYVRFQGQIATMNFYQGTVLSDAEVITNRDAYTTAATDTATVTVGVDGANDAPDATGDFIGDGPFEDGPAYVSTVDLTLNDGIFTTIELPSGSDLTRAGLATVTASQSPSVGTPPGNGFPENAFDGDPSTFTHTESFNNSVNHSWEIDFGTAVSLENITLYNRPDCCGERLRDITVTVEDAGGATVFTSALLNPANAEGFSGNSGGILFVDFVAGNSGSPVAGQTVVVTRTADLADANASDGSVLSLGEVTIIGSTDTRVDARPLFNHDARESSSDDVWSNLGTGGGEEADWILGSGVTHNPSVTSTRAQITQAYEWDGTTNATAVLRNDSPNDIFGNGTVDSNDATIEIWTKLGASYNTQNNTLFETGGGTGVGIVVDSAGILRAANGNNLFEITYDLVNDPAGVMGGFAPDAEFFQVALTHDIGNQRSYLFVNGQMVATTANTTTDWDGGDDAGLGHFEGANHAGFANPGSGTAYDTHLNGSVFAFRLYDRALGEAEIRQNFEAVANDTDVDGDPIAVTGAIDGTGSLVTLGNPATLASGAIVTITSATGDFTYDPNGSFESLVGGQTTTDTFEYQVTDGNGATNTATVEVVVEGVTDAIDDTVAATELIVTEIPANFIVGNDQPPLGTPGAYFTIDPATASGATIPNTGSGGSTYDLALSGGVIVSPPNLASNFGAVGAALQNGAGVFASLDPISTDDATFEIWFQPQPLQTGNQILVDSGGSGNGLSIIYNADLNELVFTVDGGDDTTARIQATATGVVPGEFNQLVAVYDKDSSGNNDSIELYLNSNPASFDNSVKASDTNTNGSANDWAGTDNSGIGEYTGTAALGEDPDPFIGQIGITRIYPIKLSLAQIEANYDAVVRPILSIGAGSPVTTALGATVTLNADRSISYDATSLNSDIPDGNVVQDTFTYTISDDNGGTTTATVTVDVTGVGSFLAVDDDFTLSEDDGATSLDVRANDLDAGSATVLFQEVKGTFTDVMTTAAASATPGDPADFTDVNGYGWRLMWNAPTDWDLLNDPASTTATGGALGSIADYELLVWTDSEWSPDGDEDNTNNSPAAYGTLLPSGLGHPGAGATNDGGNGNDEDRAVIVAYTVPSTGYYGIANSVVHPTTGTGVRALVFVEASEVINVPVAGGATSDFDGAIGLVNQGETIYIALSPDGTATSDSFNWDFDVVELPGPDAVPTVTFGTVTTDGTTLSYTPAPAFQALKNGESITETISYTIDDGGTLSTATVTVTIEGANDLPVGLADNGGTTNENRPLEGSSVLANDTDADAGETATLVVSEVQGAGANVGISVATDLGGTVTMQADGTFAYDPTGAFEALTLNDPDLVDTFTYLVQDINGVDAASPTTVSITVVGLESNQQVVGTGLTQTFEYLAGSAEAGMFTPPSVADPNGDSPVASTVASEYSTTGAVSATISDPANHNNGFSVALVFTPDAADLAPGARVSVYENGGTSNGNGIYLLDGIPHFVASMNGSGSTAPDSRNDISWLGKKICVPLSGSALPADVPTEIGIVFSLDAVDFTINGSAATIVLLTDRVAENNWSGSDTVTFGEINSAGNRGALQDTGTNADFEAGLFTALAGTVEYGELWFEGRPQGSGLTPESLTATLTVNIAEGDLTAPDGASYDGGTGVWTATGSEDRINGLIANTTFVPNGTSPVDVAIGIEDGGESGTVPVAGTLTFVGIVADEGTDTDSDNLSDFLERAFGTDPGTPDNVDLALDGTVNGRPIINIEFSPSLTFEAVYMRRDDHGVPGSFIYTAQFSSDLNTWYDSTDTPTVLADSTVDGDYEVVSVPYPFLLPDGKKARFFRLKVDPAS